MTAKLYKGKTKTSQTSAAFGQRLNRTWTLCFQWYQVGDEPKWNLEDALNKWPKVVAVFLADFITQIYFEVYLFFFFFCCNLVLISYLIWCILRIGTPSHYFKLHQILKTCCSIYKLGFPPVADTFCAMWFLWALVLYSEWSGVCLSPSQSRRLRLLLSPSVRLSQFGSLCDVKTQTDVSAQWRQRTREEMTTRGWEMGIGFVCPWWGKASQKSTSAFL